MQVHLTAFSLRMLPAGEGGEVFKVQAHDDLQLGLLTGPALRKARGGCIKHPSCPDQEVCSIVVKTRNALPVIHWVSPAETVVWAVPSKGFQEVRAAVCLRLY